MLKIEHKKLSRRRQCKLLPLNRSGVYYKEANNFDINEVLMRKIEEIYTNCPFHGTDALGLHLSVRAIWSTLSTFFA